MTLTWIKNGKWYRSRSITGGKKSLTNKFGTWYKIENECAWQFEIWWLKVLMVQTCIMKSKWKHTHKCTCLYIFLKNHCHLVYLPLIPHPEVTVWLTGFSRTISLLSAHSLFFFFFKLLLTMQLLPHALKYNNNNKTEKKTTTKKQILFSHYPSDLFKLNPLHTDYHTYGHQILT